jgi:hypothetical protein
MPPTIMSLERGSVFDFSEAELIDHKVMESIHRFAEDYIHDSVKNWGRHALLGIADT